MFGKFFSSAFTGSMMAAGPEVFAVWGYVIAHAIKSRVELNPRLLAAVIGSTVEKMQEAIDKLCAPDGNSREKCHEGRRLIREGEYQYYVTGHEKYRSIVNEDDRREYNRTKKAESRAKKADVKRDVKMSNGLSNVSAHTEAEAEAEKKTSAVAEGRFADFWDAWPKSDRKADRKKCLAKWQKLRLDREADVILINIQALKQSRKWRDGFEPAPLTYLNGERWKDNPEEARSTPLFAGNI